MGALQQWHVGKVVCPEVEVSEAPPLSFLSPSISFLPALIVIWAVWLSV